MDSLETFLQSVMTDMKATWPQYEPLRPRSETGLIPTQPIPFFGDIKNAQVLTVGVNPSATEFDKDWGPPDEIENMTANDLKKRLQNYFVSGQHEWFDTWEKALKPLGASYKNDEAHSAAHLDLSPRATKSMGSVDPYTFLTMMKADIQWFFELLSILSVSNVPQLVLISGTVTKCYYMDQFIKRVAHEYGFQFTGALDEKNGKAKTGFYRLRSTNIDLPVFFCSVSPSDKRYDDHKIERRLMLLQRVEEHKERLLELINGRPASAKT